MAAVAVALVVLAATWFTGALSERQRSQTRSERATALRGLIAAIDRERSLVSSLRRRPSPSTARQVDVASRDVMGLLRDLGQTSSTAHRFSDLRVRYGGPILSASAQSNSAEVGLAFDAVQGAARRALQTDELAAVSTRQGSGGLATAELAGAALVVLAGSCFLLWLGFGRPRGRNSGYEARVQQLAEQARTDSLTRLGNHRAFQDDLTAAITKRSTTGLPFTLMAIDLDGLKRINDTRGHPAGDAHIRRVAACLEAVVRDSGTVYRTGGDEFMVLLPGLRNWHGLTLAGKIDQATRIATGSRTVSVGVTESVGMEGRHLLVHQADVALYEAKKTRLSAVAYRPGLGVGGDAQGAEQPSNDQRTLAAALARAVDAKDVGTRSHSETVAQLCVDIGQRLGLQAPDLERLRLAGLLHDVGKIGVADSILQKPEPLGPDEQSAMTEHVEIGHAILLAAELPTEAHWVLHHHERYDGAGYPERLRADAIPIQSRIIAVADAFEAMTGSRPYRAGMPVEDALAELSSHADKQFDPRCVSALVEVVNESLPLQALLAPATRAAILPQPSVQPAPNTAA
jgi:diguanylate cyclase (GGDEF)-like protein